MTQEPSVRFKEHIYHPRSSQVDCQNSKTRKDSKSMFSEMCSHFLLILYSGGENPDTTETEAEVSRQQGPVRAFNS